MYSTRLSMFMCQWMPLPDPAWPPPTWSCSVVTVSELFSSSAYSRICRRVSPCIFSGQWQLAQVSRAGRIDRTGAGTGAGTLPVSRCHNCRVPASFASTCASAPGPTWHDTQATLAWAPT